MRPAVDDLAENQLESSPAPQDRAPGYYQLLSYIVSNTISGEIMAVENYSEMVALMPDYTSAIEANRQAWEECGHIRQLAKLAVRLGFAVEQRIIEPQWKTIREHFSKAIRKKNLNGCLLIQDVMTETMAILLYRTLAKDADHVTASVASRILVDEQSHLEIGTARLRKRLETERDDVCDALVWAHHRVMPELFSMVSTSCHHLCDELKLDCASLDLKHLRVDLADLRVEALQTYMETLDRIGFPPTVTNPLIASMSAYEGMKELTVAGCDTSKCC